MDHCNGIVNCADGSDETVANCIWKTCPRNAFRCAYGACISKRAECNKIKDCVDSSDEFSPKCAAGALALYNSTGKCPLQSQEQCTSGECIESYRMCNGAIDCRDGSDEIVRRCAAYDCPAFSFRCGNGACIHRNQKCNGIDDCADGSDENQLLCGYATVSTTESVYSKDCLLLLAPNMRAHYEGSPKVTISNKEIVPEYASIKYRCPRAYVFVGNFTSNVCIRGKWTKDVPYCQKYCSHSELVHDSIAVSCEYKSSATNCFRPLLPSSIAIISCNIGYKKPDRHVASVITCGTDGEWSNDAFHCEPHCGAVFSGGTPLIFGGSATNSTLVPWHVSIFSDTMDAISHTFSHICGGTIISRKIIISAAHCFWSIKLDRILNETHFQVGIGKYYRDYMAIESLPVQFLNVSKIHVEPSYRDYASRYSVDIALVIVAKSIVFNGYVMPICVDLNVDYNDKLVSPGLMGSVAGWGVANSAGNFSSVLKVIRMPAISLEQCSNESNPEFLPYITNDKFCAGYTDGRSVCEGDSGGGLVFARKYNDVEVNYLRGIVSIGPAAKQMSCVNKKYTTFTNIHYYQDLIKNYLQMHL